MKGAGVRQMGVGQGGSRSLSALGNSVLYSVAASECFGQQLRMKQGVLAPRRYLQSLCHIPIIDREGLEPLERRTCLRLKAVAAEAVVMES